MDKKPFRDWVQIGILLVTIVGFAYGYWTQSRQDFASVQAHFAKIDQRLDDSDKDRIEMLNSLHRIEEQLK